MANVGTLTAILEMDTTGFSAAMKKAGWAQTQFAASTAKAQKEVEAKSAAVAVGLGKMSDSFKMATKDANGLGSSMATAFGGAVDDVAGLASTIAGGGTGAVAGTLVGAFALASIAVDKLRDKMSEANRTAEQSLSRVVMAMGTFREVLSSEGSFDGKDSGQLKKMYDDQIKMTRFLEAERKAASERVAEFDARIAREAKRGNTDAVNAITKEKKQAVADEAEFAAAAARSRAREDIVQARYAQAAIEEGAKEKERKRKEEEKARAAAAKDAALAAANAMESALAGQASQVAANVAESKRRDQEAEAAAQEEQAAAEALQSGHMAMMRDAAEQRRAAFLAEADYYAEAEKQAKARKRREALAYSDRQGRNVGAFGSSFAAGNLVGTAGAAFNMRTSAAMRAKGATDKQMQDAEDNANMAFSAISSMFDMLSRSAQEVMGLIKGAVGATFMRAGEAAFGSNAALGALGGGVQKAAPLLMAGAGAAGLASPLLALGAVGALTNPLAGAAGAAGIAGGAGIAGAAVLGSALFELSLQTRSYARWQDRLTKATEPLVEAMEPLWMRVIPLTSVFGEMAKVTGTLIEVIIPGTGAFGLLFDATRNTALGISTAALKVGEVANKLGANIDTGAIQGSIDALNALDFKTLLAAAALDELSDAAKAALNVPEAAKVSYQRYLSLADEQGAISPDAYGTNRNNGGTTINLNGPVTFKSVDDMMEKVARGEYVNNGTSRRAVMRPRRVARA